MIRKNERKWRRFWSKTVIPKQFLSSTHARTEHVRELIAAKAAQVQPDKGRLLDVGCGTALAYPYFREVGFMYTGIDFTAKFVKYANENTGFRDGESVEMMDARRMTYPDKSFTVVTCKDVLEHLPPNDFLLVVGEMMRVARDFVIFGFFRPPHYEPTKYHVVTPEENPLTAGCYSNTYSAVELRAWIYKHKARWINVMENQTFRLDWDAAKGFSVWTVKT